MTTPLKIAVCSLSIGDKYKETTRYSTAVKKDYCARYGYTFYEDDSVYDPTRPPAWSKLILLQKCLRERPQFDIAVWMDADLFIMNPTIRLEELISNFMSDRHVMVGCDWKMSNTGVMFVRNTDWSKDFLQAIWDNKDYPVIGNLDQDSFQDLLARNVMDSLDKVKIIERPEETNSYWFNYFKGHFVIHFAGCHGDHLPIMMNRFCPVRMDTDTDDTFAERLKWLDEYRGQKPT